MLNRYTGPSHNFELRVLATGHSPARVAALGTEIVGKVVYCCFNLSYEVRKRSAALNSSGCARRPEYSVL